MEQVIPRGHRGWTVRHRRSPRLFTLFLYLAVQVALVLIPLSNPLPSWAADESLEYQVKAAFLLNFTKFIEWPPAAFEAPASPLAICVLGEDPFGPALDQLVNGEMVSGHRVLTRRIKAGPAPKSCQILFISRSGKDVSKILASLGPGVLTVGEGESFVREGGMITFVIDGRHVRFRANQAAAESAGLKLSSKLLNVAMSPKE